MQTYEYKDKNLGAIYYMCIYHNNISFSPRTSEIVIQECEAQFIVPRMNFILWEGLQIQSEND